MPATGSLQLVEAVIERFDGAPIGERRRWSDEFKAQAVAAALEPGVNVSALARRLGISAPQLFGWRKAFLKKQKALLHKSADGRTAPIPGPTYPTTFVTGMPSAVKPFRTATRT